MSIHPLQFGRDVPRGQLRDGQNSNDCTLPLLHEKTPKQYILKIGDLCSVLVLLSQDSFDIRKFRPMSVRSNDGIPSALLRHGLEGHVTNF
jgi:hypothetical protein